MLLQQEQLTIYFLFLCFFNICTRDISSRLSPAPCFPLQPHSHSTVAAWDSALRKHAAIFHICVAEKQMRSTLVHSTVATSLPAPRLAEQHAPTYANTLNTLETHHTQQPYMYSYHPTFARKANMPHLNEPNEETTKALSRWCKKNDLTSYGTSFAFRNKSSTIICA